MSLCLEEQWGSLSVICLVLLEFTVQVYTENCANNLIKNVCFVKITVIKKASHHNKADNTKQRDSISMYAITETEDGRTQQIQKCMSVY